jgi:hypothetical protein
MENVKEYLLGVSDFSAMSSHVLNINYGVNIFFIHVLDPVL